MDSSGVSTGVGDEILIDGVLEGVMGRGKDETGSKSLKTLLSDIGNLAMCSREDHFAQNPPSNGE